MTPEELAELKSRIVNGDEYYDIGDEVVALIAAYEAEVAKVRELEAKVGRLKAVMVSASVTFSVPTAVKKYLVDALRAEGLLPESAVRG